MPGALPRAGVRGALDAPVHRAGENGARGDGVPRVDSRRADASGLGEAELLLRVAEVLGAAMAAEDRRRAALEAAAEVQALLTAEAEHRIANSLQAVAGSLALQARLAACEEPLRAAAARVAAAGAVHRYLHRVVAAGQGQGGSADAAALLRTLCADLSALLSGPTGAERRQVACEVEPFPWPAARAGALATIAAELAINGAKHAPAGKITLRLSPAAGAGGDALLVAEDEGPGFPVGLDLSRASGLGMRLIRTLAGSREGRVSIDRAARGGRIVVRVAASG